MVLNRNMRLLVQHGLEISVGELVDAVKQTVIEDLRNDPALVSALAIAVAPHLAATVRPT